MSKLEIAVMLTLLGSIVAKYEDKLAADNERYEYEMRNGTTYCEFHGAVLHCEPRYPK